MNISIVGAGYLGLTTASVLAAAGHKVYCVDIKPEIIDQINSGNPHFYEPGLEALLKGDISNKNLIATLDYSEAISNSEISFICVDTPSSENGELSIRAVEASAKSIAENLNDNHIVVLKSTVPVGTAKKIKSLIYQTTSNEFHYASNPEFLAEGSSVFDTLLPDRIIIGTDSDFAYKKIYDVFNQVDIFAKKSPSEGGYDGELIKDNNRSQFFYEKPFEQRVQNVSISSAELIKMTANSFLATKISFANAIANICDKTGANVTEVMNGIGADPRIGRDFLYAGLGWGGGCFPKDVLGLIRNSENLGYDFEILKAAKSTNDRQTKFSTDKIKDLLGDDLSGKTISILGLSFKPGTSDIRVSPSINLITALSPIVESIRVFDPKAMDNGREYLKDLPNIEFSNSTAEVVEESSLVVLATDWPEFINLDFNMVKEQMSELNLFDGRNRWNKNLVEKLGFRYYGVGV